MRVDTDFRYGPNGPFALDMGLADVGHKLMLSASGGSDKTALTSSAIT